jgi:hypothetical protein
MAFAKKWIGTTILGIFLCMGMMLAGWGWVQLLSRKIDKQRNELEESKAEKQRYTEAVEALNKTVTALADETSGVAILEQDGNRYVTAPPGSEIGHTVRGRPAIKLKEQ